MDDDRFVHGAAGRNLVAAARRNEEDKNERKRERERGWKLFLCCAVN
jgi:hypothetical protein